MNIWPLKNNKSLVASAAVCSKVVILLLFIHCYPHAFLKKRRGYCYRLRPSVRPSVCPSVRPLCLLLLNHWTKFNQIWCVSCLHQWGAQRKFFFWPNFNYKVNFKDFLFQTLCTNERYKIYQTVFFILSPWSSPRGGTWGT